MSAHRTILILTVGLMSCEPIRTPEPDTCTPGVNAIRIHGDNGEADGREIVIDFGEVELTENTRGTTSFSIENGSCGTGNLLGITQFAAETSDQVFWVDPDTHGREPHFYPKEARVFTSYFSPSEPGQYTDRLDPAFLFVDGLQNNTITESMNWYITLQGIAHGPKGVYTTPFVGAVAADCALEVPVEIQNTGDRILELEMGSEEVPSRWLVETQEVAPGESVFLQASIKPENFGPFELGLPAIFTNEITRESPSDDRQPNAQLGKEILLTLQGTLVDASETVQFVFGEEETPSVLLLFDGYGDNTNDYFVRTQEGLSELIEALSSRTRFQFTSVRTDTACPANDFLSGDQNQPTDVLAGHLWASVEQTEVEGDAARLMRLAKTATADNTTGSGACLNGWHNYGAPLHMLAISDREDVSSAEWHYWVNQKIVPATGGPVVVSSIRPHGSCGAETLRYAQASAGTGGGDYDLCNSDWSSVWEAIAAKTASMRQSAKMHVFRTAPMESTIHVTVNEETFTDWWLEDQTLRFPLDGDTAPNDGDTITVTFTPKAACE